MTTAHNQRSGAAIRVEDEGPVRRLVLCRPDEYNTITPGLRDELGAALDNADRDDSVRVVLLCAQGRSLVPRSTSTSSSRGSSAVSAVRSKALSIGQGRPPPHSPSSLCPNAAGLSSPTTVSARSSLFPLPGVAPGV